MVKAVCRFNQEKVKNMSKKMRNKTLIGAVLFSVVLLAMGIFNIVSSFSSEGVYKWIFFVMGILISVFSVYPTYSAISTSNKNYKDTLEAMSLEKGELTLDFTIKEKKIELKASQAGEEEIATMLVRNFSLVKVNSEGVGLYLNQNMYYILNEEIKSGTKEELINIFKNAKVPIKGNK